MYRYKETITTRLRQVSFGEWPGMPIIEAVGRWNELRGLRKSGKAVITKAKVETQPKAPSATYTLGDLVRDYADGYLDVNRERKGARAVRIRLQKATQKCAELAVPRVTRSFVFDLISSLNDRPVLAKSVKTEMAAAWTFAMDAGRIPEDLPNWWNLVKRKFRSNGAMRNGVSKGGVKRILSSVEIKGLVCNDLPMFSQQVQDFLTIQLWTCTRGGEIVQMRPEHISEDAGGLWWTMQKAFTKNRKIKSATDLRVPLVGRAQQVVRRLLNSGGEWLFPSVSREGKIQSQTQAYMQSKVHYLQPYSNSRPDHIRKRLSVTHWSPHDLRRTGRTILASIGCPHEVAEAILGHVIAGVAGDYNLYRYDKEKRVWLSKLDDYLNLAVFQT